LGAMVPLLATLLLSSAWAHSDGLLLGIDLILLESEGIAVESNFGLLWAPNGADYTWLCHEAITSEDAVITPRYAYSEEGVLLGLVPAVSQARDAGVALYRTTDGCEWSQVSDLEGHEITDVVFDPSDPQHALVITVDQSRHETINGIFRSSDGGLTFSSVLEREEQLFRSVEITEEGQSWATSVRHDTNEGWLYTSPDGQAWTEHEVPVPETEGVQFDVTLLTASATDAMTAWVVVGPFGDDVLLRTTDGGQTFEEIFAVAGDILDGAVDQDGGLWLAVSGRELYYAADGERFVLMDEAEPGMGVQWGQSAVWMAVDASRTGHIAQRSADRGSSIDPVIHLSGLSLHDCPAETDAALYCDPLWEELESRLPPVGVDTGEPSVEDTGVSSVPDQGVKLRTCGCGGKGSAALVLPLALLGVRRRR